MPAISADELAWVNLMYPTVVVESIFYGVYTSLAIMAAYALLSLGLRRSTARKMLLLVLALMFLMSTIHIVMTYKSYYIQFPTLGTDSSTPEIDKQYWRYYTTTEILERACYLLSDAVVVWRAWVIWYDSTWVKVFLAAAYLGTFATSITLAVWNVLSNYKDKTYSTVAQNLLGTFGLLFTNFSATVLIAYKAWRYRKFVRQCLAHKDGKPKVEKVLWILTDSGAIYCIFWALEMAGDFGAYGNFGLGWLQPHFAGIYVALIVLLVVMQRSSSDFINMTTTPSKSGGSYSQGTVPIRFQSTLGSTTRASDVENVELGEIDSRASVKIVGSPTDTKRTVDGV